MFYQSAFWAVVYGLLSVFGVTEGYEDVAFLCAALMGIHVCIALVSRKEAR